MDYVNIQNLSVIGCCVTAIIWLVKMNEKFALKQEEAVSSKFAFIEANLREEKQRHDKEEYRLKQEIQCMQAERKEERREFLEALNSNTEQLKNVANKLSIIPNLQTDVESVKKDITEIKQKIN